MYGRRWSWVNNLERMAEYVNKYCGINHKDAETDADRGRDGLSVGVEV